jgi:DNA-binding transcriptional LysR family regulator
MMSGIAVLFVTGIAMVESDYDVFRDGSATIVSRHLPARVLPPPDRGLGPVFVEAFRAGGLDYPRAAVIAFPPEVRINLLATGRFLTILPRSILRFAKRPDIKILPVELQHARVPIGIVTLKNRSLSPVAQLFIKTALEVAKPLARRKW